MLFVNPVDGIDPDHESEDFVVGKYQLQARPGYRVLVPGLVDVDFGSTTDATL